MGAYDGDTLLTLIREYGIIDLAIALECDSVNFDKLIKNDLVRLNVKKLIVLPVGSSSSNCRISFNEGQGMISKIDLDGEVSNTLVQLINIDSCINGFDINKIIIDTEGSEKQSIMGLREIIYKNKPDLCIAAYHFPTDIFEIVNQINDISNGYKYYFRNHSANVIDTVLYCVNESSDGGILGSW